MITEMDKLAIVPQGDAFASAVQVRKNDYGRAETRFAGGDASCLRAGPGLMENRRDCGALFRKLLWNTFVIWGLILVFDRDRTWQRTVQRSAAEKPLRRSRNWDRRQVVYGVLLTAFGITIIMLLAAFNFNCAVDFSACALLNAALDHPESPPPDASTLRHNYFLAVQA